ncbi:MAG TPA: YkgJ family cysteine cluster protein [Kofleriaceae bacterium]|nr:YkgJ family cysteine cluster protein [Kofleriaceae bacterium]
MPGTYFTWPDRRFRYECRGCGACCKGHGIGIDATAGQLVQLAAKRPEIAAFVRRRGAAITAFNPRDRCWFLEDDGLCRVEVEDGRAAKPASCRLFPFNRVFHVGATMVVDYNSVICPLAVVGDDGVTHAEVIAEIETIQDPAIVGTSLPGDDALIERERAIADAMFAATTVEQGLAAQTDAAGAELRAPAFDVLGLGAWRAPASVTLANALMLTPSMRFNELYGPRQYAPRDRMPALLARMWLGWLGFAALGETLAQRALGLQELTTLWSEQAPLMFVLASWDARPALKAGKLELPSIDPGNVVRALAQACIDNKGRRTLGELIATAVGSVDAATRIAALRSAEPILRAAI